MSGTLPASVRRLGIGERQRLLTLASPADLALLTALEAPLTSLAEETAALKRACFAAEQILFGLSLLRDDEFAVLKRHGLDRTEVETVMNAGLLARLRVTRAESEGVV
ncbi:MAG: hypothetical protein WC138_12375 [Methanoculleus sp.]|jgi:alpha-galactosidase/6-phospho-beta-glucosidase family protein